jgi:hypothetical protein
MKRTPFNPAEILLLRKAIEIAEEVTSDHYKISTSQWRHYRYDIQSLRDLKEDEITDLAFAQIRRYARIPEQRPSASKHGEFFKICLQDHMIRHAIERDPSIQLLPLATYIVTHELIHVIRFSRFLQRFETDSAARQLEEQWVHHQTHALLKHLRIEALAEVLDVFHDCRLMETFVSSGDPSEHPAPLA